MAMAQDSRDPATLKAASTYILFCTFPRGFGIVGILKFQSTIILDKSRMNSET